MRRVTTLLLCGAVFSMISAISGIQSVNVNPRTGTVITYWHGYGRLLALGYAALMAFAFYGIYQRYPIAWKLGFVLWFLLSVESLLKLGRCFCRSRMVGSVPQWLPLSRPSVRFTWQTGGASRKLGSWQIGNKRPKENMELIGNGLLIAAQCFVSRFPPIGMETGNEGKL